MIELHGFDVGDAEQLSILTKPKPLSITLKFLMTMLHEVLASFRQ